MSSIRPVVLETRPHRPVEFKESSVRKVIATSGSVSGSFKKDGCQLNLVVDPKGLTGTPGVHFLSHQGRAYPAFLRSNPLLKLLNWEAFLNPYIGEGLFREGFMVQAEVVVTGKTAAETAGILGRHATLWPHTVELHWFDIVPLVAVLAEGEYDVPHCIRMEHLQYQLTALFAFQSKTILDLGHAAVGLDVDVMNSLVHRKELFSIEELNGFYEHARSLNEEGLVIADPASPWRRGKKVGQWKVKPDDSCDGIITGLVWGTPGLSYENQVIGFMVLTEHGVEVPAVNISDADKAKYTAEVMKGIRVPADLKYAQDQVHAVRYNPYQGWTCRILYMERTDTGSYRHPSFDCFRGVTGNPYIKE